MNSNVPLLEVKNLHVSIDDNEILKDFNLKINQGEIIGHARHHGAWVLQDQRGAFCLILDVILHRDVIWDAMWTPFRHAFRRFLERHVDVIRDAVWDAI